MEEKITIEITKDQSETVWAKKVEVDKYEIINSPFFAYGISYGDLVKVIRVEKELYYHGTIKLSGHSTYRVFLDKNLNDDFDFYWAMLSSLECTYEKATKNLYSIDVPPTSNINKVYEILELGEKRNIWEFEEGHCGHPKIIKSTI